MHAERRTEWHAQISTLEFFQLNIQRSALPPCLCGFVVSLCFATHSSASIGRPR